MKMQEVRQFTYPDARQRLADLKEELFNLRFQYATRQLTNHARIREVRRDIARIQTLLREWELQEVQA